MTLIRRVTDSMRYAPSSSFVTAQPHYISRACCGKTWEENTPTPQPIDLFVVVLDVFHRVLLRFKGLGTCIQHGAEGVVFVRAEMEVIANVPTGEHLRDGNQIFGPMVDRDA